MSSHTKPRVIVLGLGDTGILITTRLSRNFDVLGVSTKPALLSGQELGTRLTNPAQWRASYFIALSRFKKLAKVPTIHGRAIEVDRSSRTVTIEHVDATSSIESYDFLVIATGASNGFWRHDRSQTQAEIDQELDDHARMIEAASTIAIVGGGATGVSVADNLALSTNKTIHLFYGKENLLSDYHPKVRAWVTRVLARDGVHLHPHHRVELPNGMTPTALTTEPLRFSSGQEPFRADLVLWATGITRPHSDFLPRDILDDHGFVIVDEHLVVSGQRNIFAVGDVAASDPLRSSARNWGWKVVIANINTLSQGKPSHKRFKATPYRWGSILGLQDRGLTVFQPNGRRFRFPASLATVLLFRGFTERYLYGGIKKQ
jgi:NADH dehydrogenase FAD-containing subunit